MTPKSKEIAEVNYLRSVQTDQLALADKLKASDDPEAVFVGMQLSESVADENLYVGFDMTSKTGERFTGRGNLVGTSSRLDRFYLQKQAKLMRAEIERFLSKIQLRRSERWRFLTLTMPKLRGVRFGLAMKVFDDAFTMLRKSVFWERNVRAAVKSKEFTLGAEWKRQNRLWTLDEDGYHIHGHLIAAAEWLENRKINKKTGEPYDRKLAKEWKKCLLKSARKNNVVLSFDTGDGLPIVDVRLIKNRAATTDEISLKDAIAETAKYITKPNTLKHLPEDQTREISNFLKGKRMLEPLGEANDRKGKGTPKNDASQLDAGNDAATISINGDLVDSDTSVLEIETIDSFSHVKKKCIELIKRGEKSEAAAFLKRTFDRQRAFRRRQLTLYYPDAEFMTLDGEIFSAETYAERSVGHNCHV